MQKIINNVMTIIKEKYFCFEGRAGREEFWLWFLAVFAVNFVLGLIPGIGQILSWIVTLGTLLPYLGVGARRMHDIGKSGWFQLVALIPIVGFIILLILWAKPGETEANKYGEVPAPLK